MFACSTSVILVPYDEELLCVDDALCCLHERVLGDPVECVALGDGYAWLPIRVDHLGYEDAVRDESPLLKGKGDAQAVNDGAGRLVWHALTLLRHRRHSISSLEPLE